MIVTAKSTAIVLSVIIALGGATTVGGKAWDALHSEYMTYTTYRIDKIDDRIVDRSRQIARLQLDGENPAVVALYQGELVALCDEYQTITNGDGHVGCR